MESDRPTALHFGAGNIGRGFIAPILIDAGYHVIFADVNEKIIKELNEHHAYEVHILDHDREEIPVEHFSGVLSNSDDVVKQLARVELVTTAIGFGVLEHIAPAIAKGIQGRRATQGGPLDIIACENALGATAHLKEMVYKHLEDADRAYADENVGFANCSVDRIVPPFNPGENNELDVGVEGFFEWVVEEPALRQKDIRIPGMKLTHNLVAYNERKLFTLNTGHCIAAYLGYLRGLPTIADCVGDEAVHAVVRGALEESGAALIQRHGFKKEEHEAYIDKIEARFRNPEVKDDVVRVGRQPLRKLGRHERLLGPLYLTKEYGVEVKNLPIGIAAAFHYADESDEQAKGLQTDIREKGIGQVIVDVTGFAANSEEHDKILAAYHDLNKWKKGPA